MVKKPKDEEMRAICSSCFASVPIEQTHVQPGYNDYLRAYVTCYRCETCRMPDLVKTRERVAACTDAEEITTGELFFARYGIPLPDAGPDDTVEAIRDKLLVLIDRLASGELRITIDPKSAVPIKLPDHLSGPGADDPFGDLYGDNPFGGNKSKRGGSPGSWLTPG